MAKNFTCLECGKTPPADVKRRFDAEFCCAACRKAFNNRAQLRGRELYDFAMNWRQPVANGGRDKQAFKVLCSLLQGYHEDDETNRGGRKSYRSTSFATRKLPRFPANVDNRASYTRRPVSVP